MKILYKDCLKRTQLQEMHLAERNSVFKNGDGSASPAYRILNCGTGFVTDRLHKIAESLCCIHKENKWHGDTLDYAFDANGADDEVEALQTICFGGDLYLDQFARDLFWTAIKTAFKRGDNLFDVEECYEKYEKEAMSNG